MAKDNQDAPVYIYSTLQAAQDYGINDNTEFVHINGGAHLTTKQLVTPKGVVTPITAEQYLALQDNHVFKLHVENKFIVADEKLYAADDVAEALNPNDPSKPATVEDLKEETEKAAEVSGADQAPVVKSNKPAK